MMNCKNISNQILYSSWINNQNPLLKKIFNYTFNMYIKYNQTSKYKLFHTYIDHNLSEKYTYQMVCIGMAKFKHSKNITYPFYLFVSDFKENYFSGYSCCIQDHYSRYTFDKYEELNYIDCPYTEIDNDMYTQFLKNFKFSENI